MTEYNDFSLLAKPDRLLVEHIEDLLLVLRHLQDIYNDLDLEINVSTLWTELFLGMLFHDFGKSAKGFQEVLIDSKKPKDERLNLKWKYRHEMLSAALLPPDDLGSLYLGVLTAVVTHHKDLENLKKSVFFRDKKETSGKKYFYEYLSTIDDSAIVELQRITELFLNDKRKYLVKEQSLNHIPSKIIISPTKSAKNPSNILYDLVHNLKTEPILDINKWKYYLALKGLLTAADHLASAGFTEIIKDIPIKEMYGSMNHLWVHQRVIQNLKGSTILIAPTGTGKTESAFLWSDSQLTQSNSLRIFYILPYTASINAMYKRLLKKFGTEKLYVTMLHHRATYFLSKIHSSENDFDWNGLTKDDLKTLMKKIYSPIKILTPFQILKYLFGNKGFEQRLIELSKSAIVLDEIHTYNPRLMAFIIESLVFIKERFDAKILLMSATFPKFLQTIFIDALSIKKENILSASETLCGKIQRHKIHIYDLSLYDFFNNIKEQVGMGKKVLIVCNTIGQAQIVFNEVKKFVPVGKSGIINGLQILRDREIQEANAEKRTILVGTQAIEISLDISFDILYTEAAPIDALIQRFGRINRRTLFPIDDIDNINQIEPADIIIVMKGGKGDNRIYPEEITKKTIETLQLYNGKVLSESIVKDIIEKVYEKGYEEKTLEIFNETRKIAKEYFSKITPLIERGEGFDSLIDGVQAIPKQFVQELHNLEKQKRWDEVQQYFLSISRWRYMYLKKENKIIEDDNLIIISQPYDDEIGLIME